jgi:hypothetical protein
LMHSATIGMTVCLSTHNAAAISVSTSATVSRRVSSRRVWPSRLRSRSKRRSCSAASRRGSLNT